MGPELDRMVERHFEPIRRPEDAWAPDAQWAVRKAVGEIGTLLETWTAGPSGRRSELLRALQHGYGNAAISSTVGRDGDGSAVDEALRVPATGLDLVTRRRLERSYGTKLDHVRVHRGEEATNAARALGANAFTVGHDIVLGDDREPERRDLIAHEVAHVVQHDRVRLRPGSATRDDRMSRRSDASEHEAESAARSAGRGQRTAINVAPAASVSRDEASPEGDVVYPTMAAASQWAARNPVTAFATDVVMNPSIAAAAGWATDNKVGGAISSAEHYLNAQAATKVAGVPGFIGNVAAPLNVGSNLASVGTDLMDLKDQYDKGDVKTATVGQTVSDYAALSAAVPGTMAVTGQALTAATGGSSALGATLGAQAAGFAPVAAVLGAAAAGWETGKYLEDKTSVGEHEKAALTSIDTYMTNRDGSTDPDTGLPKTSWMQNQAYNMSAEWDRGNYLSSIGAGGKLAGAGIAGAFAGLYGGAADAASWAAHKIAGPSDADIRHKLELAGVTPEATNQRPHVAPPAEARVPTLPDGTPLPVPETE